MDTVVWRSLGADCVGGVWDALSTFVLFDFFLHAALHARCCMLSGCIIGLGLLWRCCVCTLHFGCLMWMHGVEVGAHTVHGRFLCGKLY